MPSLMSLWLPILLSTVFVFIASSIIWMALPIHKKDYGQLGEKEDAVMSAVRSWGLRGGMYMFPMGDCKNTKDPALAERMKSGPWGVFMLRDRPWNMGSCLGLWAVNILILTFVVAYVAAHALPAGAAYLKVFQIVGATALLAHGGSVMCDSIWKGRPWSHLPGALFDAIVYALLTAGTFGWLWPKASAALPVGAM